MSTTTTTTTSPSTIMIEGAGAASVSISFGFQIYNTHIPIDNRFPTNPTRPFTTDSMHHLLYLKYEPINRKHDKHSGSSKVSKHANENILRFLQESPELESGRYEEAIKEAIKKEEAELLKDFRDGEEQFATSGSTAALALVNLTQGFLVIGNLGDSHILMADYTSSSEGATNIVRYVSSTWIDLFGKTRSNFHTASDNEVT
ncbi:unnamed protein product [Aspergillus oryzae var. brunneus]|uniref:Unnamed protein product n=2 Tax=Aspergillus oryzae TaxID=5062 RepID=A0AAN4YFD8_ASPOZ|nr:unnamed protein product [Aspergillus oryzae]GMG53814.1 unnamed protein product [Aspergillus oryzae var. brunneus]